MRNNLKELGVPQEQILFEVFGGYASDVSSEIDNDETIICTCQMVSDVTIKSAIEKGYNTLPLLQEHTGAMTGCQQKCKCDVEKMLACFSKK